MELLPPPPLLSKVTCFVVGVSTGAVDDPDKVTPTRPLYAMGSVLLPFPKPFRPHR